jgi:hypothetical protein
VLKQKRDEKAANLAASRWGLNRCVFVSELEAIQPDEPGATAGTEFDRLAALGRGSKQWHVFAPARLRGSRLLSKEALARRNRLAALLPPGSSTAAAAAAAGSGAESPKSPENLGRRLCVPVRYLTPWDAPAKLPDSLCRFPWFREAATHIAFVRDQVFGLSWRCMKLRSILYRIREGQAFTAHPTMYGVGCTFDWGGVVAQIRSDVQDEERTLPVRGPFDLAALERRLIYTTYEVLHVASDYRESLQRMDRCIRRLLNVAQVILRGVNEFGSRAEFSLARELLEGVVPPHDPCANSLQQRFETDVDPYGAAKCGVFRGYIQEVAAPS